MTQAYQWAFINPLRKILYNLTTTALSIAIALIIGTMELLQVAASALHLRGSVFEVNFGTLGYLIVGLFVLAWAFSTALWKYGSPAWSGRPAAAGRNSIPIVGQRRR
jgi:high-affinity nickel-transport protein